MICPVCGNNTFDDNDYEYNDYEDLYVSSDIFSIIVLLSSPYLLLTFSNKLLL